MTERSPSGRACGPSDLSQSSLSQPEALVPNAVEVRELTDEEFYGSPDDDFYDDDDNGCHNCGGEGFTYGCSWDWQCDTYDEGEGTCLCTRRCEFCFPPKRDPSLLAVLTDALAAAKAGK